MTTEQVQRLTFASARQLQCWDEDGTIKVEIIGKSRDWKPRDVSDVKFMLLAAGDKAVGEFIKKALVAWRANGRPVRCTMSVPMDKQIKDMNAWSFKFFYKPDDLMNDLKIHFGRRMWILYIPESVRSAEQTEQASSFLE